MLSTSQTPALPAQIVGPQRVDSMCINHEAFIIYVRTKQFMKKRFRGIDEEGAVHIPMVEIASRFFPYPKFNCRKELRKLVEGGLLRITESKSPETGHKKFQYEALQPGKVDLYLIKPRPGNSDPETQQMIEYLKQVTVAQGAPELPIYFQSFLDFRDDCMNLFVSVDEFAGRIHTPISNLQSQIRPCLLIDEEPTAGIDVATMQPLLLGKILKQEIGTNDFTCWLESGEDIYIMLQQKAGLLTRDEAKDYFFKITFGWPNNKLAEMFGNSNWIEWINEYKNRDEPLKTIHKEKTHNNVAWLLQTTEVNVMRKVWRKLIHARIPFLTVHDEVIIKQSDRHEAEMLFRSVLDQEFTFYKLNIKQAISDIQNGVLAGMPSKPEPAPQPFLIQPEPITTPILFMPLPPPPDLKHDYIAADGILYTHWPGLPNLC